MQSRVFAFLVVALAAGQAPAQTRGEGPTEEAPRTGVQAILIRNPDPADGAPPYALADQFGRVQRLVEASPGRDIDRYVGERVRIRHDSGRTLLASQIDFPELSDPGPRLAERPVRRPVSPAQFIAPRGASRIEDADARPGRRARYAVRPAQVAAEEPAAPLDLDRVIAEEERESLPTPARGQRLEPIPAEENYPETVEGEVVYDDSADGGRFYEDYDGEGGGCPHCSVGGREPYYEEGPSPSGCAHCRAKRRGALLGLCATCGRGAGWCGPTCDPPSQPGVYGRVDYLLWWVDGMNTPPLVTTNDLGNAPLLGDPGTRVVYQGELVDDARSGLRLTVGAWLDNRRDLAIEGDWLVLETETDVFSFSDPTGAGVLGRPFYNVARVNSQGTLLGPGEDVQLVAFNEQVGGTLDIRASSRLQSLGLRARTGICCRDLGGCGPCGCSSCSAGARAPSAGVSRVDFTAGYRFIELEEILSFNESVTNLANESNAVVNESFDTNNEFHGVDLGFVYDLQSRRWGLELTGRVALGNTQQRVIVAGSTTSAGQTAQGGILAQTSNIGRYERDRFSAIPELGARLSYRVTPRLSVAAGYTLLYWANVVRPGDVIDYSIDGRLAPVAIAAATANSHPRFDWEETSVWAHGLDVGLDYRY